MREAAAAQPTPTIEQFRADFDSRGIRYPLPGDVLVSEIDAGGVPAHWLTAPEAAGNRTLLYLHGGGYQIGSIRSDSKPRNEGVPRYTRRTPFSHISPPSSRDLA